MRSKLSLALPTLAACLVGCGSDASSPTDAAQDAEARLDDAGVRDATGGDANAIRDARPDAPIDATADDGAASDLGSPALDAGPRPLRVTTALVTDQHRFVPGAMFGGWGPHLGHLVRAEGGGTGEPELHWVDDLCTQGTGDCDVNVNRRVGIFRRDGDVWTSIGTIPLPAGVQQNTGTIASAGLIRTYGVDTAARLLVECVFDPATATSRGCGNLMFPLGSDANYVGAALSPAGAKVVWWTNVVDGGGGSFSYVVEYTMGWNGPRAGVLPGYNDCAYAHAAFRTDGPGMTFFGQAVTGRAPAWAFSTLVGESRLDMGLPVTWANALAPPAGDSVASTNDLWIDPTTQDTHLIARTTSGAAAYYFRPRGGDFGAATIVDPSALRARWVVTADVIALVYGPNGGGLRMRTLPRSGVVAGGPLAIEDARAHEIPVPDDLGPVVGIYPEASVYQSVEVPEIAFVVVGNTRQNEALFFEVRL